MNETTPPTEAAPENETNPQDEAPAEAAGDADASAEAGTETEPPAGPPFSDRPVTPEDIQAFGDIPMEVSVLLGHASLSVEQFLKLGRGAIVELKQPKEDPLMVEVNGHPVARANITVIEDKIGVTLCDIEHPSDLPPRRNG